MPIARLRPGPIGTVPATSWSRTHRGSSHVGAASSGDAPRGAAFAGSPAALCHTAERFGIAGTVARGLGRLCLSALLYLGGCGSISYSSGKYQHTSSGVTAEGSGWNGRMTYRLSGPCTSALDARDRVEALRNDPMGHTLRLGPLPDHIACLGGRFDITVPSLE